MHFEEYLSERVGGCGHAAAEFCGIKLQKDTETGEHSALVEKDHKGMLKVARLHNHLADNGWKHEEHPSGHVYTHPSTKHTVTIYHKGAGSNGDKHHEIVLGKS